MNNAVIICCNNKYVPIAIVALKLFSSHNTNYKEVIIGTKFDNNIKGDDTKFYDYFLSVNRFDKKYINCMNYKKIPDNTLDIISNVNIKFNLNKLKEKMFFDEKGIKNYTKYLYKKLH